MTTTAKTSEMQAMLRTTIWGQRGVLGAQGGRLLRAGMALVAVENGEDSREHGENNE